MTGIGGSLLEYLNIVSWPPECTLITTANLCQTTATVSVLIQLAPWQERVKFKWQVHRCGWCSCSGSPGSSGWGGPGRRSPGRPSWCRTRWRSWTWRRSRPSRAWRTSWTWGRPGGRGTPCRAPSWPPATAAPMEHSTGNPIPADLRNRDKRGDAPTAGAAIYRPK